MVTPNMSKSKKFQQTCMPKKLFNTDEYCETLCKLRQTIQNERHSLILNGIEFL